MNAERRKLPGRGSVRSLANAREGLWNLVRESPPAQRLFASGQLRSHESSLQQPNHEVIDVCASRAGLQQSTRCTERSIR